MRVLHVASELFPLVKTGGLGDVAAALPAALAGLGEDVRILVPGFPPVQAALRDAEPILADPDLFGGGAARLLAGRLDGVPVPAYVLDCPAHFDRPGNPYLDASGADYPDNHLRFAALCWAAARLGRDGDPRWRPDILHAHDWQTGLAPAYLSLAGGPRPATVITIHNLAFQGRFPAATLGAVGLPARAFSVEGVELYGQVGFLKAGLYYADRITTVSRTYAREIQTPGAGHGLDGLLRTRAADLVGIVNGIDAGIWDPARDRHLPLPFDAERPDGKQESKAALQRYMGLPADPGAPLFGVVSRLTWHKGMDLLFGALPALVAQGAQFVLLGSGDRDLEGAFTHAARIHPDRVAVRIGYDEGLAHLIQAGADVVMVPSREEPCGLTQLYALRYGALPLVRRTGGLADTVVNADPAAVAAGAATGLVFDDATVDAVAGTVRWACDLYRDRPVWRGLMRNAMTRDFGWPAAARQYLDLYRSTVR